MSIKANDLSLGQSIMLNNKVWRVIDKSHVKPGKGGAFIQTKLKSIDGIKLDHRFQPSDTIEIVLITKKTTQFSYKEKETIYLSDNETYETIEINKKSISKESWTNLENFADENTPIEIEYADETIIDVILPNAIEVTITNADPVVKGQTAASSYKNAIIKENIKILVPPYVNVGDKIIINPNTENGIEFVKRAN